MKQSGEVDVDAIFRIDELLEKDDEDVPPEHQAWYDEYDAENEPEPEADKA